MRYYSEDIVKKLIGYAEYNGTFGIHESLNIEKYPNIELPDEHGDLIERDKLPHYEIFSTIGKRIDVVDLEDIKNAPTVLKATK